MLVCAVVSDSTEEAVAIVASREAAETIVRAWDRNEPDQVGALHVESVGLEAGTTLN
jgi:hypothetical protein